MMADHFNGDVTALPDLSHGRPRTGPVRDRRPVYIALMPPCPAGENIHAWQAHARAERHEEAWRQLITDNPFAAIHGRVCYHRCESVATAHISMRRSRFIRWIGSSATPPVTKAARERAAYVWAVREANSGAYGTY